MPRRIIAEVRARAKVRDRAVVIAHVFRRRLVDQIHAAIRGRPQADACSVDSRERIYLEIPQIGTASPARENVLGQRLLGAIALLRGPALVFLFLVSRVSCRVAISLEVCGYIH